NIGQPAAQRGRHVVQAHELHDLHIDRATQAGLESGRTTGVVHARTCRLARCRQAATHLVQRLTGIGGQPPGTLAATRHGPQQLVALDHPLQTAIEQGIGNAGLGLHALGQFDKG
ncbi:hypothetical protein RZS08_03925, partial [Arthrospira platensis SPKY1]|nr:hypothetical protein [Arthrospira platensis SPKY1]